MSYRCKYAAICGWLLYEAKKGMFGAEVSMEQLVLLVRNMHKNIQQDQLQFGNFAVISMQSEALLPKTQQKEKHTPKNKPENNKKSNCWETSIDLIKGFPGFTWELVLKCFKNKNLGFCFSCCIKNQNAPEASEASNPSKQQIQVSEIITAPKRGLVNLGNTCYMNAALQCLQHSDHLLKKLQQEITKQLSLKQAQGTKLLELFQELDKQLKLKIQQPFKPLEIKQKVAETNHLFFHYQQCDAVEFISTFLTILSKQLSIPVVTPKKFHKIDRKTNNQQTILKLSMENDKKRGYSVIDEVFASRYRTTYVCQEPPCNFQYILFQKFNIHYLEIPDTPQPTLVDCLRLFQKEERIQGQNMITCEKCQQETVSHKSMKVYSPNKILTIVLKRFRDGYKHKNTKKVKISQKLTGKDISSHCKSDKEYRLYAACLHYGTIHYGHYTAVCLDRESGKWILCNDDRSRELGGFKQDNFYDAYALFYEQLTEKSAPGKSKAV